MAPNKRKTAFSNAELEQMLSQITLASPASHLSATSNTENFESLGPLVRNLQALNQQDVFLSSLNRLVEDKEREIEAVCAENYQDFVGSVGTLTGVRKGTGNLRRRIAELDGVMSDVGKDLLEKKKALLKQRKIAENLDSAIETLQSSLRVLDLVNRIDGMIKEEKCWGALRSLEDIQHLPLPPTPFLTHILSSLPSLRAQIKDKVTASQKAWLFEIREKSGYVGELAIEEMERRKRRWAARRDRDLGVGVAQWGLGGVGGSGRVGGAIECLIYEKTEFDPIEAASITFKPLYQCIHIYDALDLRGELQQTYGQDRQTQAHLILSPPPHPVPLDQLLLSLTRSITGFFVLESHVLRSAPKDFRSQRDVDFLWDEVCRGFVIRVERALKEERAGRRELLSVRDCVLRFGRVLESYDYAIDQLTKLLLDMFTQYIALLEKEFSDKFDEIILNDDYAPKRVDHPEAFEEITSVCWMSDGAVKTLSNQEYPVTMPFSSSYLSCCIYIREFVERFYNFVDDLPDHGKDIDALLRSSIDRILTNHVSESIAKKLEGTNNFSLIAQIVINLEHFELACEELNVVLSNLRLDSRLPQIKLSSTGSLSQTLIQAQGRISDLLSKKLDSFFELAEIDFTPDRPRKEGECSEYLREMIGFLANYVDSVLSGLGEEGRQGTYRGACKYICDTLMKWLTGLDFAMLNENGLRDVLLDIKFVQTEMKRLGKMGLEDVFEEINSTVSLVFSPSLSKYIQNPRFRPSYPAVSPQRLSVILHKLGRHGLTLGPSAGLEYEKGLRRRNEADVLRKLPSGMFVPSGGR
ncbi:Exocyst complex, subunit SEC15 [Phaffia rhodozyma]|uniref:Exocyst complex component SEC15 n=1 Tax=Phaffia rhodozyma TaxID=264483 RepID=A0A0F7SWW9_PHARH|nr:Exocyst complex, subunit SEC15 [Phaffia rhodozyma]